MAKKGQHTSPATQFKKGNQAGLNHFGVYVQPEHKLLVNRIVEEAGVTNAEVLASISACMKLTKDQLMLVLSLPSATMVELIVCRALLADHSDKTITALYRLLPWVVGAPTQNINIKADVIVKQKLKLDENTTLEY